MGRVVNGLSQGVHHLRDFTDRRTSTTKVTVLSLLIILIGLFAVGEAVYALINIMILATLFYAGVAAIAAIGFHATRNRRRHLLQLYALVMLVIFVLHIIGLLWTILSGVVTLSFNLGFLLGIVLVIVLLCVEGYSILMAWSLAKDLDPTRVAAVPSDGALEAGEQEFTFGEEESAMEFQQSQPAVTTLPVYQPNSATPASTAAMVPGTMPVYNPVTGTYGQQPAAYAAAAAPSNFNPYVPATAQPYGYPAAYPTMSPAPSTTMQSMPAEGDVFDFASFPDAAPTPLPNPAQPTSIIEDGEFDPFQERSAP